MAYKSRKFKRNNKSKSLSCIEPACQRVFKDTKILLYIVIVWLETVDRTRKVFDSHYISCYLPLPLTRSLKIDWSIDYIRTSPFILSRCTPKHPLNSVTFVLSSPPNIRRSCRTFRDSFLPYALPPRPHPLCGLHKVRRRMV